VTDSPIFFHRGCHVVPVLGSVIGISIGIYLFEACKLVLLNVSSLDLRISVVWFLVCICSRRSMTRFLHVVTDCGRQQTPYIFASLPVSCVPSRPALRSRTRCRVWSPFLPVSVPVLSNSRSISFHFVALRCAVLDSSGLSVWSSGPWFHAPRFHFLPAASKPISILP